MHRDSWCTCTVLCHCVRLFVRRCQSTSWRDSSWSLIPSNVNMVQMRQKGMSLGSQNLTVSTELIMSGGWLPSHFSDIEFKRLLTQCNSFISPSLCCIPSQQILLSCRFPLPGQLQAHTFHCIQFPPSISLFFCINSHFLYSFLFSLCSLDQFSYFLFTESRHQARQRKQAYFKKLVLSGTWST